MCASLGLMALLILVIGAKHYISEPPLFIPPPESERTTLEEAIANSNNLDIVKKTCANFARCRDQYSAYTNEYSSHLDELLIGILIAILTLFGSFSYGYFKIYKLAKKLSVEKT